jgi:hypothetical protein
MLNTQNPFSNIGKVELLLEEVYQALSELDEENFDVNFPFAKQKMESVIKIKKQNSLKTNNFKLSKKNIQMAKLISEKFDNVTKDWTDKLKMVQKEIELIQNQKKIIIYNR